jgi:hypothetical protein
MFSKQMNHPKFSAYSLTSNKSWDVSQVPICYVRLLNQPFRLKFVKTKLQLSKKNITYFDAFYQNFVLPSFAICVIILRSPVSYYCCEKNEQTKFGNIPKKWCSFSPEIKCLPPFLRLSAFAFCYNVLLFDKSCRKRRALAATSLTPVFCVCSKQHSAGVHKMSGS